MNPNVYRQTDSRWKNLPYPSGDTIGESGCGCVAVTHCVIEKKAYWNFTPKDTQPFMKKYAVAGQGTKWTGITAGLKNWGYTDITQRNIYQGASMPWSALNKKKYIGVMLMGPGSQNGVVWTTGGHFVAFLDYKIENDLHYFYIKDSSNRKNDGWFCYEKHMSKSCDIIWYTPGGSTTTGTQVITTTNNTTKTTILYSSVGELIAKKAEEFAWPAGTSKSKYCRFNGGGGTAAFWAYYSTHYKSKLNDSDKSVAKGTCCCHFARTCVAAALNNDFSFTLLPGSAEKDKALQTKMSKLGFSRFKFDGNQSSLIRGDVCYYRRSAGGGHVWIYLGNGKCAEASHNSGYAGRVTNYSGNKTKVSGKTVYYVFRNNDAVTQVVDSEDTGAGFNLQQTIAKLYSSDNYKYLETEEEQEDNALQNAINQYLQNASYTNTAVTSLAIPEPLTGELTAKESNVGKGRALFNKRAGASLQSIPTLVEAPLVVLDFNGVRIGGFNNDGDTYPNYITALNVIKTNGKINQYTIQLTHQIRYGEDPNYIDKLLSRTGYVNSFKILYGDATGEMFNDEDAILTNVTYSEDVASSTIHYTISAISSLAGLQVSKLSYPTKTMQPSTAIFELLYDSSLSEFMLDSFPAMRDKNFVISNNLIPTTDDIVQIAGMTMTDPTTYLSHLVSCMKNKSNSSYYLSYCQDSAGTYFKITEVKQNIANTAAVYDSLYQLDIGYPTSNFIRNFQLSDNTYYSQVYSYNDSISNWNYGIDDNGNILANKSNKLLSNNKYLNNDLVNSNWWNQVTEYPVSAKVTLKGLSKVAMLMTYVKVNAVFYGQKDIASGIYVVTQQEDSVSANGYTTTLTLLRVAGDDASLGF